jgi:serine/threonine-protein kinase
MTQPHLIGGRYHLGQPIGYGGMAEVHKGRDTRLGREVAIKVLRADLARDPAFQHRFRREAQSAAGLNHPSIVAVYDTGEDVSPDGTPVPYIVMEYVQGRTLREILKAEGRLPVRRALEIVGDVCAALDFSHRHGIVHRDIKPANVMITDAGAVKVMDFGIARALADDQATITQTANVIGTAQYLSPEQARGETVDARSDVYSTGCLLYELVAGSPPFQGDSPVAVAYQHVRESAAAPSTRNREVPPAVDAIVMKAIAKNQLNRYQTAGEMRADLQRALANQPVVAESVMSDAERTQFIARTPPPVGPGRSAPVYDDDDHRSNGVWIAIVAALVVVIGAAVAAILLIGKSGGGVHKEVIPSLVGQLPQAALDQLRADGFDAQQATEPTSGACDGGVTVADGHVCTVNPMAGGSIAKGSVVTITIYKTPNVSVPNLVGLNVNDAETQLHDKNLPFATKNVDDPHPEGTVVAQSKPPFSTVAPGTTITLSVSSGQVKLPSVLGKTRDDAVATLNSAGWTQVDTTQVQQGPDQTKDGTVVAESPTPGIAYPQSTQVALTIYQYVAASASNTATDTGTTTGPPSTSPSSS